jgi:hypothetical protein
MGNPAQRGKRGPAAPVLRSLLAKKETWTKILFLRWLLSFFYDNSAFFTDFNAALASETFLGVDRYGFAIRHFKNFDRTYIYAFFTTNTFFVINDGIKSHYENLLSD